MRIGIDASNIRAGGGLTHLREVLCALDPAPLGIREVRVWGGQATLAHLPDRPWLIRVHPPELDGTQLARGWWRRHRLDGLALDSVDVLFSPGGVYGGRFRPFVTMSQNLLPFDPVERARFGLTPVRLRYHMLEWAQSRTFRRADGVIFLTPEAHRIVERRTGPLAAKIAIIPHGLAERFFQPLPPVRALSHEVSSGAPLRVLYVSIVNFYKHPWHVADAVARLRREGLPVHLDLVGPAYPPALRRLKETLRRVDPQGEGVQYHGAVPYERLHEFYAAADLFVFASSCETFGMILLEAMAAGLPIACARRSALPDVLGEAGHYFDPEDPEDIARALRTLILNPDLRRDLARQAQQRARLFSWRRCAFETFQFIRDIHQASHP
ncbi:MAG: glycosyltransferase family 4 protein [Kiritimatiellae bacterium]|nr:glycosyltransferase family 4 protein [Kiritimatiellia bacterium]